MLQQCQVRLEGAGKWSGAENGFMQVVISDEQNLQSPCFTFQDLVAEQGMNI